MPNTYVNKVTLSNGATLIDLTSDTVTSAAHIVSGRIGHLSDGSVVTGTAETGSGAASIEDVPNTTGTTAVITGTEGGGDSVLADYLSGAVPSGEFDITGYTLKKYALAGCTNLTRIIGTVTQDSAGANFIAQESGVTSINVTIPTPPSGKNFANIFSSATQLTTAVITIEGTNNNTGIFTSCTKLKTIDATMSRFRTNTFAYVTTLDTIILRRSSVTALENTGVLGNTKFKSGGTGGTIYIPKTLYDELGTGSSLDYKAATNWSTIDGYGTITWAAIEGSQYENYYADGTAIS